MQVKRQVPIKNVKVQYVYLYCLFLIFNQTTMAQELKYLRSKRNVSNLLDILAFRKFLVPCSNTDLAVKSYTAWATNKQTNKQTK